MFRGEAKEVVGYPRIRKLMFCNKYQTTITSNQGRKIGKMTVIGVSDESEQQIVVVTSTNKHPQNAFSHLPNVLSNSAIEGRNRTCYSKM